MTALQNEWLAKPAWADRGAGSKSRRQQADASSRASRAELPVPQSFWERRTCYGLEPPIPASRRRIYSLRPDLWRGPNGFRTAKIPSVGLTTDQAAPEPRRT